MKSLFLFLLILFKLAASGQDVSYVTGARNSSIDSLKQEINITVNDTLRMGMARSLAVYFQEVNRDSSLLYHLLQLKMARKLHQKLWEADALDQAAWVLCQLKNYPLSLTYFLEALAIVQNTNSEKNIWNIQLFSKENDPGTARETVMGFIHNDISVLYSATGNTEQELANLKNGLTIGTKSKDNDLLSLINLNLSEAYLKSGQNDSARIYGEQAMQHMNLSGYATYRGHALNLIGRTFLLAKDYATATIYFDSSATAGQADGIKGKLSYTYLSFAELYKATGKTDSAILYTRQAIANSSLLSDAVGLNNAYLFLYSLYKDQNKTDSAYAYLEKTKQLTDSINRDEKTKLNEYQNIGFNEQVKQKETEQARIQRANNIRTYTLLAAIALFMLIAFMLYRNNRTRKKANNLLQQQKKKIESTLSELKAMQSQLIQSEKMASLGELTAGIAHEIQNPLNFVNNFSELSKELLDEMKEALARGDTEEANALAADVIQNLEKIVNHGKRADGIVKGMLQHSRTGTGQKEPTDINDLCDEYLRLAYHGLRAKDKSFNAKFDTDFDKTVGKIDLMPQEFGRVILNLINNAFYAVSDKAKLRTGDYIPTVKVITKRFKDCLEIRVEDNGNGILPNIVDKIFQPFFTTKPTGQGTGLGLSLAYDIVKAHGGELKVETNEGRGTLFIIQLPVSNA